MTLESSFRRTSIVRGASVRRRRRARGSCASRAWRSAPRTYRSWKSELPADRTFSDAAVIAELRRIRTGGPGGRPLPEVLHGRWKMTAWLDRTSFLGISKHTVDRLMASKGMDGLVRGDNS